MSLLDGRLILGNQAEVGTHTLRQQQTCAAFLNADTLVLSREGAEAKPLLHSRFERRIAG